MGLLAKFPATVVMLALKNPQQCSRHSSVKQLCNDVTLCNRTGSDILAVTCNTVLVLLKKRKKKSFQLTHTFIINCRRIKNSQILQSVIELLTFVEVQTKLEPEIDHVTCQRKTKTWLFPSGFLVFFLTILKGSGGALYAHDVQHKDICRDILLHQLQGLLQTMHKSGPVHGI